MKFYPRDSNSYCAIEMILDQKKNLFQIWIRVVAVERITVSNQKQIFSGDREIVIFSEVIKLMKDYYVNITSKEIFVLPILRFEIDWIEFLVCQPDHFHNFKSISEFLRSTPPAIYSTRRHIVMLSWELVRWNN